MEHHLCVILYSKYSQLSIEVMKTLENSPVNIIDIVGITPVCIDNEEIRTRILKANQINISTVPCILIVYPTGGVEKYEGHDVIKWIEQTLSKYTPPPPREPPPPPQREPPPPPITPPQKHLKKKQRKNQQIELSESESDSNYESNSDSESVEEYVEPKRQHPKKQTSSLRSKSTKSKNKDNSDFNRPPVAIRNGPGGYVIADGFEDSGKTNSTRPTKQIVTGGVDLMSTAMAMQKERESVDSKNNQRPI